MAHLQRFFDCISTQLKLQLRAASVVHTKEFISGVFRNSPSYPWSSSCSVSTPISLLYVSRREVEANSIRVFLGALALASNRRLEGFRLA